MAQVMASAISSDRLTAWTVGADHFLTRYNMSNDPEKRVTQFATLSPGRSALALRDDDRLLALAGWDGRCIFVLADDSVHDR